MPDNRRSWENKLAPNPNGHTKSTVANGRQINRAQWLKVFTAGRPRLDNLEFEVKSKMPFDFMYDSNMYDSRGVKRRAQMDIENEPRASHVMMRDVERTKVQTIIKRLHPRLRNQLNLNEEFLIELKATDPEVISDEEHDKLRTKTGAERIDYFLELIKLKPTGAYFSFMEVLGRKDGELYNIVQLLNVPTTMQEFISEVVRFDLQHMQDKLRQLYLKLDSLQHQSVKKMQTNPFLSPEYKKDHPIALDYIFVDLFKQRNNETAISSKESTQLDSNEKLEALKTNREQRSYREGEGGSGSALLANIAYEWALRKKASGLLQYKLVFLLSMHEIQDKNASVIDLIYEQLLPDSKESKEGLKAYIISHPREVLLLVDGLHEDTQLTI